MSLSMHNIPEDELRSSVQEFEGVNTIFELAIINFMQ